MSAELWPWMTLLLLGGVHGVNPGMGWLFAVALGLQEGSGRAVWRALLPLAAGHAAAIALAVAAAALIGQVVPIDTMKWGVAAALLGLGAWRLVRHRHPRAGGMQVGGRDIALWSFLMATAHGAGLMVLPITMAGHDGGAHDHGAHRAHAGHEGIASAESVDVLAGESLLSAGGGALLDAGGFIATALHTAGYLLVTGLIAVLIYEKVGLRFLRSAWINLDVIWAGALVVTAVLTVLY